MKLSNNDIPGLRRYDADETGASRPWFWYGAMALDGTVAPWSTAPVRSLYLYTSGSTAILYVKTIDNNATADWTNLALAGEAETLSGVKTFTAKPVVTIDNASANAVTDVLKLEHTTSGTPAAGIGAGIQINLEDAGGSEEQARIDVALSSVTNGAEDADLTIKLNIAGTMTTVIFVDADEGGSGGAVLFQLGADAKPVKLDLHPPTTARGTVRYSAADSAGDTITEIVNASQSGARTYTVPDAGASAEFVMSAGDQAIGGNKTFSSPLKTSSGVGAVVAGKATAVEYGDGAVHKTVLTLTLTGANDIDLADSADHGAGVTIYDMPAGRILLLGATCDLSCVVNDAFNASPNDVFNVAVGSVAADDADGLSGTEVDIIPASALDTVGNTTLTMPMKSALAASAQFDGTTNAMDVIVNATVADASTTKALTLAITGTLTLSWVNLGDY